jgi:Flp pilus assembly protein TadB
MQIVVSELPIEDAVGRARTRFQRADERLSLALAGSASGLSWVALGVLVVFAGAPALTGIVPLSADAALVIGVVTLVLGGIFLGYGLPLWSRARKEKKRRTREWQHALEMLRLRERQAEPRRRAASIADFQVEQADIHHHAVRAMSARSIA